MNLAPLRYRQVTAQHGGPIERIESGTTSVMGERMYQANAYLRSDLRQLAPENQVFGDASGTGTSRSASRARHIAISEALERWAHLDALAGPDRARYGFDLDWSTNGMAAYPGLFGWQARRRALGEAAERFCLVAWWAGKLQACPVEAPWPGVRAWHFPNPVSSHSVVLLHAGEEPGAYAYATAAGDDYLDACGRAAVELVRAQFVLRRHATRSQVATPSVTHLFERRCLYFATEAGNARFRERMRTRAVGTVKPEFVFDGPIPGPWSQYAMIWRVVVRPPDSEFLSLKDDFFFW